MTIHRERQRMLRWCAAWAAAWLAASGAWAECKLSQLEIPVRIVNQRPIGTLTLNGTEVPLLVDSGAFYSMLALSTAQQLNLPLRSLPDRLRIQGYTGRIEAQQTQVRTVGLGEHELHDVEFIVGGNELGSGIMGVLGRNFLSMADTEYDLAHGVVRLMFPKGECKSTNFAYWAGEAPVIEAELAGNMRDRGSEIVTVAQVNDVRLRALLDTGAPTTTITRPAALRAGIKEDELKDVGRTGGAGAGRVRLWKAPFRSFVLGGEKITDDHLLVADTGRRREDMLLGLDYFLSHRIYVSRLQDKLYATWNGTPVFARGAGGAQFDERYAARPDDVPADDAQALARRGQAAAARGEWGKALEDLNRACALAPTDGGHLLARARVHLGMRARDKALQDLDEALRLSPQLREAQALRASLRIRAGQREAALADLAALDATLPASDQLRAELAEAYASLDLSAEAFRQWALWMPTHADDMRLADALNHRCWLRVRLNIDPKLALEDCQAAVDKDRTSAANRDSLGWAYLRLDDARRAAKAFDAAIEIRPEALAHYGRALALQRLGQAEAATRDLAAARRLGPNVDARARRLGLPVAADAPAATVAAPEPEAARPAAPTGG